MADNTQGRKDFERTLSTAIGFQAFMSSEHNEMLIEGAKKR